VYTTARHWSLSWARWIRSTSSHPLSLRPILISFQLPENHGTSKNSGNDCCQVPCVTSALWGGREVDLTAEWGKCPSVKGCKLLSSYWPCTGPPNLPLVRGRRSATSGRFAVLSPTKNPGHRLSVGPRTAIWTDFSISVQLQNATANIKPSSQNDHSCAFVWIRILYVSYRTRDKAGAGEMRSECTEWQDIAQLRT
jgi:hypothetical protein